MHPLKIQVPPPSFQAQGRVGVQLKIPILLRAPFTTNPGSATDIICTYNLVVAAIYGYSKQK